MSASHVTVRPWRREDAPMLLGLMRGLAAFEGYEEAFAVTEEALLAAGLGPSPAFAALVAERDGVLLGMAITYEQPWTYDLKPWVVLKELYVAQSARGAGVGTALFGAVIEAAKARGASRLNWTVLRGNDAAAAFYRRHGGRPDPSWQLWTMSLVGG
jgi:GNAT superfamily N-acetyltransferase